VEEFLRDQEEFSKKVRDKRHKALQDQIEAETNGNEIKLSKRSNMLALKHYH
jgi:hypothetical protein